MILRIVYYDEIHSGQLCGCYYEKEGREEGRQYPKNTRIKIRADAASPSHQRSNNFNKIGGECSRSTVGFSGPPGRQSSKFLVLTQRDCSTYHVSVVPDFSVIVITCPFENEISPGYNASCISSGSQPQWVITNLDCIEIKQRDCPSNAFPRGQRSS